MQVVDSLQRQLSEEGAARKRMISKLKKEQKRAKLMCEVWQFLWEFGNIKDLRWKSYCFWLGYQMPPNRKHNASDFGSVPGIEAIGKALHCVLSFPDFKGTASTLS